MKYPLIRHQGDPDLECQYDLELDYEITDFTPAAMTDEGRDDYTITLTSAWLDGKVFALTDAEIAGAEAWLMERVEV